MYVATVLTVRQVCDVNSDYSSREAWPGDDLINRKVH